MRNDLPLTTPEKAKEYRARGFWRDEVMIQRFMRMASQFSDSIAMVDGDRRLSFKAVREMVDLIAGNLLDLGVGPEEVVAFQSHNCAEFVIMNMAAHRIGGLYLPLHDSWRHVEVKHLLNQAQASVFIVPGNYRDFNFAEMVDELRPALPYLKHTFRMDEATEGFASFSDLLRPHSHTSEDLDLLVPDPDSPAAIMLSGGTTSLSKMSRYSSNNILGMLDAYVVATGLNEKDVAAALAPGGTGATGYLYPMLVPLLNGATSVILQRWSDPEEAIELIAREKCTFAVGIPTQLVRMIPGLEKRKVEDFSSLRVFTNAGAPLAYDTARRIEALMGCVIQTIYGSTDGGTPTMTLLDDPSEKRLGSVGRVIECYECELRDEDGKAVLQGESGEIFWRSPHKSWGYLNDEAATDAAFTSDNYYASGDLGRFDEDNYLQIVGRVRDMILRGGRNISPRTVEELMMLHPAVLEVAIAAMPDVELGERACAFVVPNPGRNLTFDEMIAFLKEKHLAVWQLPERLEIMDELPRSTGAKIAKGKLTEFVTLKLKVEGSLPA